MGGSVPASVPGPVTNGQQGVVPVPGTMAGVPTGASDPSAGQQQQQQQQSHQHSKNPDDNPVVIAQQNRILTEATRKVQEHAYYMRQAMDKDDLPGVLDRAAHMVAELGDSHHGHHGHHHHGHNHHHQYGSGKMDVGGASQLTPKNYYELHMRALEDMPNLEEYFLNLTAIDDPQQHGVPSPGPPMVGGGDEAKYTMKEVYDAVQFCPRVLPRLYLQISAGSALIRSKEVGAKWVLNDIIESVKCVQCPLRGLFLRHFLLQALRDKLPDFPITASLASPGQGLASPEIVAPTETPLASGAGSAPTPTGTPTTAAQPQPPVNEKDPGTVKDAYEFVLANFIESNKLWVRIQHLPGEGKSKEQRKRRERERNELRILVGTNLVRLSQLEGVTSQIYGEIILPKILEQIVACRDALAQAYLIDCIIQVFPDEYHIETLGILLSVCPKLKEKVNIRTILQSLMDRLANYYADEELLDEADTNQVKKAMAQDSFSMFEECVQNVYNARGPNLTPKEVIRLQTALLNFSLKCYPGSMDQVNRCLGVCVASLRQANGPLPGVDGTGTPRQLDEASVNELEKLLSIPLDSLALKVLELDHYSELLTFLPWDNRRDVAMTLVRAVDTSGGTPRDVKQIEELFTIIAPVIRDEHAAGPLSSGDGTAATVNRTADLMKGLGVNHAGSLSFGASFNDGSQHNGGDVSAREIQEENNLVSKLVHLLHHEDTDVAYEMLSVARKHLSTGGKQRVGQTLIPVAFSALRLVARVYAIEFPEVPSPAVEEEKTDESPSDVVNESTPEEEKEVETADKTEENPKEEPKEKTETTEDDGEKVEEEAKESSETAEDNGDKVDEVVKESVETADAKAENEGTEADESVVNIETNEEVVKASDAQPDTPVVPAFSKAINCRKIFVFLQKTVAMLAKGHAEVALKLYLQIAVTADRFSSTNDQGVMARPEFGAIAYEFISQAFILHEEEISDSKAQQRCIVAMIGTLLTCNCIDKSDYESLITKTAQYAAKILKKPDQCKMVSMVSHLFYKGGAKDSAMYQNPQRVLECLQRSLKIADACTMQSPSNIVLFVDLLDQYVYFYEKECPLIQHKYISGLIALIKEHLGSMNPLSSSDVAAIESAKAHFNGIIKYVLRKKQDEESKDRFSLIECGVL